MTIVKSDVHPGNVRAGLLARYPLTGKRVLAPRLIRSHVLSGRKWSSESKWSSVRIQPV